MSLKKRQDTLPGRITSLGKIIVGEGMIGQRIDIFLAEDLIQGKQMLEGEEAITIEKYSLPQLIQMINQGKIKGTNSISSLFFVQNRIKEKKDE